LKTSGTTGHLPSPEQAAGEYFTLSAFGYQLSAVSLQLHPSPTRIGSWLLAENS
jgi:hypothetical protein